MATAQLRRASTVRGAVREMTTHDLTIDYSTHTATCKNCGYSQYSAAPQPVLPCMTNEEVAFIAFFLEDELIKFRERIKRIEARPSWNNNNSNA